MAATAKRSEKIALLAELLRAALPDEVATVVSMLAGEARQGRVGVGWAAVGDALRTVKAAGADERIVAADGSDDGDHPTHPQTPHLEEMPDRAEPPRDQLTPLDVDAALDQIVLTGGAGSQAARAAILGDLFARASAEESEFLRRLLLGGLRQGALEGIVVEAVAVAAGVPGAVVRRALMLGGDLGQTATLALAGGADALLAVRLEVLRPLRPMLASSAGSASAALFDVGGTASVEWKIDGARIQVHRRGGDVRVFTRNLNDITHRVPDVVEHALGLDVESVVLDGETLTVDEDGRPRAFQDTMSRFGADDAARTEVLRAFYFDVLHLDGRDLVDETLGVRLAVLDRVVGSSRVPGLVTDDPVAAEGFASAALAAGHEGVMVKAVGSAYEAGRRGKSWVKVKPVRTLDLVVLGVEWGHGRRNGWLSNLHLGARDPSAAGTDREFVMVGKTFKGMTDEMLRWQTARFLELERGRHGITVWVRPEQVVEIALDAAQASTRYPGGVALRFARVLGYRDDKAPHEADTIDSVRALLPGAGVE